ncbi:4-hydroxybenzoate polyprenyltransferase [Faunimonas pinastri]|uniref:4-hydroxybenzoate octaprenyltransferase n=1 Tax=Faunimonas pinastri TaxID=1855383 RepID=A0A1H8ZLD9_9HYPH|nr:4-hydroxybenzoate octaprenyltransferase [Faunimonas pinastri]SEP65185.1 4-hydroxybenzoate polyprenyltransferase [Faunimonas pinastri]
MVKIALADRVLPDARPANWLDRYAPDWLKPYGKLARWDRPIGWWLLLWPCWWSAALAAIAGGQGWPNLWHLVLFMIGAIAMRGAGCTYNDIVDRDLDAGVERTRMRPIPSGAVTSRQAVLFLVCQALLGLVVLLQFNRFTVLLGIGSLVTVAVYPFMKRVTDWPQLFLGFAFSWGAFLGWSAVFGRLDWAPVLVYFAAILWTIGYDTIYALQDKEDDALIGIRSTARLFGDRSRAAIAGFDAGAIVLLAVAFALAGAGSVAFAGLVVAAVHITWQLVTLDPENPENCLFRFKANSHTGWIVFAGLVLDALIRFSGVL